MVGVTSSSGVRGYTDNCQGPRGNHDDRRQWKVRRRDMVKAMRCAGNATPGPDGIPFAAWKTLKEFGIDLSFVATRSGLTRWEEHKEKDEFADEEEDAYDPDNPKEP